MIQLTRISKLLSSWTMIEYESELDDDGLRKRYERRFTFICVIFSDLSLVFGPYGRTCLLPSLDGGTRNPLTSTHGVLTKRLKSADSDLQGLVAHTNKPTNGVRFVTLDRLALTTYKKDNIFGPQF